MKLPRDMTLTLTLAGRAGIRGGMIIYKLLRPAEWAELHTIGTSPGAPVDRADGYVHFSTAAQLPETARKHFAAERGVVLAALEADRLDPLRWEPSRGGDLFPHLYRELRLSDLLWARALPDGPDGPVLPDNPA